MVTLRFVFVALTFLRAFSIELENSKEEWRGWQSPGCHRVGHTRKIRIPDCVEFPMTTNACRGYCESWAAPSSPLFNPSQPITSIGECCNIIDTEPIEKQVLCSDGIRTLVFKSAVTCSCYHCKKY